MGDSPSPKLVGELHRFYIFRRKAPLPKEGGPITFSETMRRNRAAQFP